MIVLHEEGQPRGSGAIGHEHAVVARGVGSVAHLMRLALPLLRPQGKLLLRKPPDTPELQEAESLLASPAWAAMHRFPLPESGTSSWDLAVIERAG